MSQHVFDVNHVVTWGVIVHQSWEVTGDSGVPLSTPETCLPVSFQLSQVGSSSISGLKLHELASRLLHFCMLLLIQQVDCHLHCARKNSFAHM